MIKIAIRFQDDTVAVFEKNGEQLPQYQGQYEVVWRRVRKEAPADAVFAYGMTSSSELQRVSREEW